MIEKTIYTRVQNKHATESEWLTSTLVPLVGELIVYEPDDTYNYSRYKIGDGVTAVNDLPFSNVQPDWNQNDTNAADYVKNRTHYSYEDIKILWEEFGVSSHTTYENITDDFAIHEIEVEIYSMVSGALLYKETLQKHRDKIPMVGVTSFFGNAELSKAAGASLLGDAGSVADCPILICGEDTGLHGWSLYLDESLLEEQDQHGVYRFLIKSPTELVTVYVPLAEQYIPNNIPKVENATVGQTLIVKSVDENAKPTEWETADAITPDMILQMFSETGAAQPIADADNSVITTDDNKILIL